MLSATDNEDLCRVGPDTVMGRMMRRYWWPVLASDEMDEPGGDPKRVRLLGQDFVAFRSTDGTLGLLDEPCPHRGASLLLGRNEDCGLRCIYHGWVVGPDGAILETPNEPESSRLKERVTHRAYPIREVAGLIWVYVGEAGSEPPMPNFEWMDMEPSHVAVLRMKVRCNWAQTVEGTIDSSHTSILHTDQVRPSEEVAVRDGGSQFQQSGELYAVRPSNDTAPRISVQDTPYGFRYGAIRTTLREPEHYKYVRTTLFVAPVFSIPPTARGWGVMQFPVPIDDYTTMFHNVQYCYDAPVDLELAQFRFGARPGIDIDDELYSLRGPHNGWNQDRDAMRSGASFTGLGGVMAEDIAVQESMGPIFDRSNEHLGTADRAINHFRRMMLQAARRHAEGEPALGQAAPVDLRPLRAEDRIIEIDEDWEQVGAVGSEPVLAPSS